MDLCHIIASPVEAQLTSFLDRFLSHILICFMDLVPTRFRAFILTMYECARQEISI